MNMKRLLCAICGGVELHEYDVETGGWNCLACERKRHDEEG